MVLGPITAVIDYFLLLCTVVIVVLLFLFLEYNPFKPETKINERVRMFLILSVVIVHILALIIKLWG